MPLPSIFNAKDREALVARLGRLAPGAPHLWGRMDAPQMVWHLDAQLRQALSELEVRPRNVGIAKTSLVHWIVIDSPLPWPRGRVPTAPEYVAPEVDRGLWSESVRALRARLETFAARGEAGGGLDHPAFGKLNGRQAGRLLWRHWNHHLTQFGV